MSAESLPVDKLLGQVLANRYEILHRLGEGAMGAVYKARHIKVGRTFAVKVLHARLLSDPKIAQRFAREAELAGRLRHPNVVGVVDVGEVDGVHYMVMDFAEGPDLAQLLSEAPMPPARIIGLVRQMLQGLGHAHEHELIHRDFKPENVIVERDSHGVEMPRIVDFGIALLREGGDSVDGQGRLTTNGLVLGTPHYMAPEQAVADPIDHRIDLFALGIVVYEMLSGRLPFDGSGAEVARANLLLDPPAIAQRVPYLEVDPLLEAFARHLMAKKRNARPPTADAARQLLDLIERDRRAAGVALGVSSEVSARAPAITQAVVRHDPAAIADLRTASMRPTPHPGAPLGAAVPSWSAPPASQPVPSDAWHSPERPPHHPSAPVHTMPGPPIVFSSPPLTAAPHATYPDTVPKAPLGWPPSRRPPRRTALLVGGLAIGTVALVTALLLTQRRPVRDEPHIELSSLTPSGPGESALAIEPAPAPVEPPAGEPAPPPTEPAGAPRTGANVGGTALDTQRPPAPADGKRTPTPPTRPSLRAATPGEPRPTAPARPLEVKPTAPAPAETKPLAIAETRPEPRLAAPKPATPANVAPASPGKPGASPGCDTTPPPVAGITPAAVSNLWYGIPAVLGKNTPATEALWTRFTRYNIQELMRAPQAAREQGAAALWRILKEARCLHAP